MDEYVQRIADIARFAQGCGLGLEVSLLSPLEVIPAYRARTGECGVWMQYRKGLRDPKTGAFSFGATPEAIRETTLFRARYYRLLQDGVETHPA